jgi:hypothetical protein
VRAYRGPRCQRATVQPDQHWKRDIPLDRTQGPPNVQRQTVLTFPALISCRDAAGSKLVGFNRSKRLFQWRSLTKTSSAYRRLSKWYAQELLDATLVVEYTMHGAVGDMDRSMSNSAYDPKQCQASHVEREHGYRLFLRDIRLEKGC